MILRVPGDAVLLRAAPMERVIFRTRCYADLVSFANDSELLTLKRSRSEQDSSVRVFAVSQAASMQFGAIECFHEAVVRREVLAPPMPIPSASSDERAPAR